MRTRRAKRPRLVMVRGPPELDGSGEGRNQRDDCREQLGDEQNRVHVRHGRNWRINATAETRRRRGRRRGRRAPHACILCASSASRHLCGWLRPLRWIVWRRVRSKLRLALAEWSFRRFGGADREAAAFGTSAVEPRVNDHADRLDGDRHAQRRADPSPIPTERAPITHDARPGGFPRRTGSF